jgi:hypothetical protein
MQKNTSTVLIAFLAGLVLAGGSVYLFTSSHNRPAAQQAVVQAAQPVQATPPAQQAPPAVETPEPAQETEPAAEKPAEKAVKVRHKPRPTGEHVAERRKPEKVERDTSETSAAPQPTRGDVAQNVPPAPVSPVVPAEPAQPPRPSETLNPPPGTQTAPPPVREPKTVTLPAGTTITVRVNERISTDTNYAGDTFTASLDRPLVIDGFIIADRGARVTGKVLQADRAGRVKGLSNLSLALTQIHTTDGQTVNIETTPWTKEGSTSKKRDAAEVAGGAALGAIIGAIAGGGKGAAIGAGAGGAAGTGAVLTTRGKAAEVPAETRVTFALSNNVPVTERLN